MSEQINIIKLAERIKEIARNECPDYPTILEELSLYEYLWAIEQSLIGIKQANEDCQALIGVLIKRLNISYEEALSLLKGTRHGMERFTD